MAQFQATDHADDTHYLVINYNCLLFCIEEARNRHLVHHFE